MFRSFYTFGLFFLLMLWIAPVCAANDQKVEESAPASAGILTVAIEGVEGDLLTNVRAFLEIAQFDGIAVPSLARLKFLHRAAPEQIRAALRPFGYYRPEIDSQLVHEGQRWIARYQIEKDEPIKVVRLDLKIIGAGENDPEFSKALEESGLRRGMVLDHASYEALKKRLQLTASKRGYFDATLQKSEIRIDLKRYQAEIVLHFFTGERYRLGEVRFHQSSDWISEDLLRRYVSLEKGQLYDAGDLQQLQADLTSSDYFKQVELHASPQDAVDHVIPVEVKLQPRKAKKIVYGIGYGTDTGVRGKVGVTGRRVNRRGHKYTTELLVSEIRYGIAGEYLIPGKDPRHDVWGLRASYLDEHSDTRDFKAWSTGGFYRFLDKGWFKTYALDYRIERYTLADDSPTSQLLIPSVEWTMTLPAELEERIQAENGAWIRLYLRGGFDALLSDTNFLQPQVSGKWIRSLHNRHRLIGRASIGTTWVDEFEKLPISLRFFTGGDRTLRGYKYNAVAPTRDNEVVGGKHLIEASLEYEFPIKENWSMAVFLDSGDAFDDQPDYKTGVGIGLHWRSPIGPIRFDFGHALDQPVGNELLFHLTIGPDL